MMVIKFRGDVKGIRYRGAEYHPVVQTQNKRHWTEHGRAA